MNLKRQTRRLMLSAALAWLGYAIVANYRTFWSAADFAGVADSPPTTYYVIEAGWPVAYVEQYYSIAFPIIGYEFDFGRLGINALLILLALLSAIFVAWDVGVLRIRHLLLLTAVVGCIWRWRMERQSNSAVRRRTTSW